MKVKYGIVLGLIALLSFIGADNASAITALTTSNVVLMKHFTYGGSHCGVGTDCFVDNDGEVQGMAITPRHIVIAHGINGGYGADGKVRVYFISRKTLKIEKMIPNRKDFSCYRLGDEGCYGHGSSAAYNSKTDKVWITAGAYSGDTSFQFDDKTMKYEKSFTGIGSAKLASNTKYGWFFTGHEGGGRLLDENLNKIGSVNAGVADCLSYEEGPGSWGDYVVTNTYRDRCGGSILQFYNYKTSSKVREYIIGEDVIGTDIIEQVGFLEDGTMVLSIPKDNSDSAWGHGLSLYGVSGKTLGISSSTNTKMTDGSGTSDKSEPKIRINPARRAQCATILLFWCDSAEINGEGTIRVIISFIASIMTAGIAVMATIGIIYSGFIVMTASGNVAQVTKAKQRILEIVVGILIWILVVAILDLLLPASEADVNQVLTASAVIENGKLLAS